jgi:hypothetical protein
MDGRGAREIVEEMLRRQQAGDDTFLDELVAVDMVNHAAGPQGRSGLAWILRTIDHDLGPVTLEQHHLIGDGDVVAQHVTLHGTIGTRRCHCSPTCLRRVVPSRGGSSTSGAPPTG